jgi:UPF0755 protein
MKGRNNKYIIGLVVVIIISALYFSNKLILDKGIKPRGEKATIYIPTGSTYSRVLDSLEKHLIIANRDIFNWVAQKKNYPSLVKAGRYVVEEKMSYFSLINMLRSGSQEPVRLTFTSIRTVAQLAGRIGKQIEADSARISDFLSDPENYRKDGFTRENVISVFIPNTYEFYWNTSASGFYTRMLKEYRRFWTDARMSKARSEDLTPVEVAILASIIDEEVAKVSEKPRIAGVYLNRLKRGIPLQACPTIKFALNDFTITRVLNKHLQVDSPYNTYRHKGFPPGPIGCPTIEGLDAVLNAEKHDYLYFAAKADFSGYHNFSRSLAEHNRYANEYQRELDKRKIFK